MFEEFLESKSKNCFNETPTTPSNYPELASRYKLEAKLILSDNLLAKLDLFINSISPLVNQHWTESKSPKNLPNSRFDKFFSTSFLEDSVFCITDNCPSLSFNSLGIKVKDMPSGRKISGVSFGDSYFISSEAKDNLGIHFHELVHGVQAKILGMPTYLTAYTSELAQKGYRNNFFEKMAYRMHYHYMFLGEPFNVSKEVLNEIKSYSVFN